MEAAVQKLDEQLDQLGNSLRDDSLTDDAKKNLLPFVVKVARSYVEEEEQQKLQQGLEWARVALSLGSNNDTTDGPTIALLEAKLSEATAIDKLDQKHTIETKIEQPLPLAIERLKQVGTEVDKVEASDELKAALKAKAASLLQENVDVLYLPKYSLRRRYESKLRTLVRDVWSQTLPNTSPLKGKGKPKPMAVVRERKGLSPLGVMRGMTAAGLGLADKYDDKPVPKVLAAWRKLPKPEDPKKKKKGTDKAKKLEEFLDFFSQSTYSLDFLRQHDAFRGSSADSKVSVVSWNAQLMNKIDGPNDACIEKAIEWKAKNIGKVVAKPGGDAPPVSLLVIQEAPGPQLRASGGTNAKRIARGKEFTKALENALPAGFNFAEVALETTNNGDGKEMGEDHIYGWHESAMTIKVGPTPLPEPEGEKWVRRAPSYALFKVKKWGASLLVVSVHAKSVENNSTTATENDVGMIGRAVQALEAKLNADDAAVDSVLIVGDFNLPPDKAKDAINVQSKPVFGDRSVATNIWHFNGTGDEEKEGHAYDHGFVWARPAFQVRVNSAELASLSKDDVQKTHKEMQAVADAVLGSLADANLETDAAKRALSTIKDLTDVKDRVPSWMRQIFQKEFRLSWSDHLPIVLNMSMARVPAT